ncbi:MAG: Ppx/GppA family phosphatase [Eggerthellaceae bacterium]|nr:Ppx/GppA family phosphatase [Eggerthellaceae bacterium]
METGATVRPGRYAIVDVGTVTCRMLVADIDASGALHELRREYSIVNLGEGVDASRTLQTAAIERAAAVIGGYRAVVDALDAADGTETEMRALATSAARDAANRDELVERVGRVGVGLSVIPGQTEARLSFAGASMDFPGEHLLVVDVGGGSTEIVAGCGGQAPQRSHSFDVGCRRMTERYLRNDPPSCDEIARAEAWALAQMEPFFRQLREDGIEWGRLIAVAGTATSAVSIKERMDTYDSSRVHGYAMGADALREEAVRLASMPLDARRTVTGLDPDRAPVIVAGLSILSTVIALAGVDSYTASETDILQGAALAVARGERL